MNRRQVLTVISVAVVAGLISSFIFAPGVDATDDKTIVLSADNLLILNAEVNESSVGDISTKARKLDEISSQRHKPMYLFLNTPGGSIIDGLRLIDSLNGLRRPTNTITFFAASMGFQIVQNLKERYMLEHSVLMSHRAKGEMAGEFGGVSPNQLENRMKFWSDLVAELDRKTVSRTNGKQTLESYTKSYVPELWLTSSSAITGGYADSVANVRCDKSLDGSDHHRGSFVGMEFTYDTDKCPLNPAISNVLQFLHTTQGSMSVADFTAKGGALGADCLLSAVGDGRLCAIDTSLSFSKIEQIKAAFVDSFRGAEHTSSN